VPVFHPAAVFFKGGVVTAINSRTVWLGLRLTLPCCLLFWVKVCCAYVTFCSCCWVFPFHTARQQVKKTVPAVDNWLAPEGVRRRDKRTRVCCEFCVLLSCATFFFIASCLRLNVVFRGAFCLRPGNVFFLITEQKWWVSNQGLLWSKFYTVAV
jgi:hypothetical protein